MSGYVRKSLGTRLAEALNERAERDELIWRTVTTEDQRLAYEIRPGSMWADPQPSTLQMSPGETATWLGIEITI